MYKNFNNFESAYYHILNLFNKQKTNNTLNVKKILNVDFCIENPRQNLIKNSVRNLNYKMLLGELLYHLQGKDDLESICYYNKSYNNFTDNNETINGMLGSRIFSYDGLFDIYDNDITDENGNKSRQFTCEHIVINQYENCIKEFNKGKDYFNMVIFNPINDINTSHSANISNLVFVKNNNELDLNVNILEMDFYVRFPYVGFVLSTLQALLAANLKLNVGKIHFYCNLLFTNTQKCDIINIINKEMIYKKLKHLSSNAFCDEDLFTTMFDIELLSRIHGELINIEDCKNKIDSLKNEYWMSLMALLVKMNTNLNDFDDYIIEEHKILL